LQVDTARNCSGCCCCSDQTRIQTGGDSIEAGSTRIIFLDFTLEAGAPPPQQLRHWLWFSVDLGDRQRFKQTIEGIAADLQPPAQKIGPRLRGQRWVEGSGLFTPHHRRSFNAVNGRESLAQRFGIDWLPLGRDGHFFRNDASANTDFASYGAAIIAVADGVVSVWTRVDPTTSAEIRVPGAPFRSIPSPATP